jgi:cell division transport system permease protein
MFLTHAKRIVRSGYRNFMRSGFTSLASILMMVITLFVITSLIYVQTALQTSLNDIKEKVDVTIYFVPGADEPSILNLKASLSKLPEVKDVVYISAEEALVSFKDKHANDYLTLQALDELSSNPLGATLNVRAHDPSQYESITKYFDNDNALSKGTLNIIDKIDYHQNKVIIAGAQRLGFAVSLILILISIIITFSTIRLIIYMSREEIGVMKLVGAGSRYIRGPFIVSGMFVGLTASLVTILLFIPISIWLGNQATDFLGINLFTYFKSNFLQLFIIMLGTGVLLGSISSFFAIARYLRK